MNALLTFVERFKLTTKLLIGFSTGLLIAIAIGVNALMGLSSLEAGMEKMYENDVLGISAVKDSHLNLIYMGRALRTMLIAPDAATRDGAQARFKQRRETLMSELAEARQRMYRAETIARYDALQADLIKSLENMERAVAMIQREPMASSVAGQFITSQEYGTIIRKAEEGLGDLVVIKEKNATESLALARTNAEASKRQALILLVVGILIAGLLGLVIGLSIRRPYDNLRLAVKELAAGKVDAPIPHADYPNEIGVMARAIAVLQGIYRQADEQHWVKSHTAEIGAALQGAEDFQGMAQTLLSKLAPVIGAGHGAYYVADTEGQFSLLATYGYRERKHLNSSFRLGEGLVGQCAMEKAPIVLTAPKDYIRINSGLGEGPPACIMVMPIIHGGRVLGVLELASFQQFTDREKAVMEALLPTLATGMEIIDRNLRTKELLAATREQAERMEKQAAQLEEQTVEMEAQQSELLETENWFRSIIETAPDGMLVADTAGRILLANPQIEHIFGYEPGELIGNQIESLVPARARADHSDKRQAFLAEGRSREMSASPELTGLRKDGSEVRVFVTLSPLPARGTRGKCVSVSVRRC